MPRRNRTISDVRARPAAARPSVPRGAGPPPGLSLLAAASILPDAAAAALGEWFRPFGLAEERVAEMIGETTATGRVAERADDDRRTFPAYDEPAAGLFRTRTGDDGLVCLIMAADGGGLSCAAAWPLLPPGRGYEVRVEGLTVSPDRLVGFVHGTVENGPSLIWFDPLFALHRSSYASGDVSRVALSALAHSCGPARALPPVRLAPETPLFGDLGREGAVRLAPDGTVEVSQDETVAIGPIEDGPPCTFAIRGRVEGAHLDEARPFLDRPCRSLLVCVSAGAEDLLLRLIVPDLAWPEADPPQPGDMIEAVVLLQGRVLRHRDVSGA